MTTKLEDRGKGEFLCFLIGPIGDKHSDPGTEERRRYEDAILTLENVIVPACKEVGLETPIRSDTYSVAGEIPEQVFRLLRDADVVIADVTGGNPNVMYELGLRHSKNYLTLQVGEKDKLPFDISSIRTIQFRRTEGGYIDAKNELRAMLEAGLVGRFDPVTATRVWLQEEPAGATGAIAATDAGIAEAIQSGKEVGETEPPGFLEILAESEETFPHMTQVLEEISQVTQDFGKLAERGTQEMEESEGRGEGAKGKLLVAIRFAERLDEPLAKFKSLANSYRADVAIIRPAIDYLLDQVEAQRYEESEREDIREGLSSFKNMGDTTNGALVGIRGFRASFATLSNAARPLRSRVKSLENDLDTVIEVSNQFVALGARAGGLLEVLDLPDSNSSSGK